MKAYGSLFVLDQDFKQALKTSKESGLQYSYLKKMFTTLVHRQEKFLAPEKVVQAKDFLE